MIQAGYSQAESDRIKNTVDEYTELRNSIKIASGDYIDLKAYEPEMRQLLDMYLSADPSRTISNFGDATLLQIIVEHGIEAATGKLPNSIRRNKNAMAETLEANMRKVITQEMPINPVYYEKMSVLLEELIRQRKLGAISYEEFLKKIEEYARDIQPKKGNHNYPSEIDTKAKMSLYDNLNKDIPTVIALNDEIIAKKKDDWIGDTLKERMIINIIKKYIVDQDRRDAIFEIIKNQKEYR